VVLAERKKTVHCCRGKECPNAAGCGHAGQHDQGTGCGIRQCIEGSIKSPGNIPVTVMCVQD
jgi:hypothetical protein